jgi:hypothetical protein
VSTRERPEDKKTRFSFVFILFVLLGVAAYLNHGRMRPCCANSDAWKIIVLIVIGIAIISFVTAHIRRANRRNSK